MAEKLLTELELEDLKDKLPSNWAEKVAKKFDKSIAQAYKMVRDANDLNIITYLYTLAAKEKQRTAQVVAKLKNQFNEL